jgi:DNA polymerase I-like protein with 3'-5' exonuclease and polymerase domains
MLIATDASQLEWRVCLELSQDPVGIREILQGADTHSLNQQFFGFAPGPEGRHTAKIYLFRTIFNRGQGYAFTQDPDFMGVSTSIKFWDEIGKKFYTKYEYIDKLYDKNLSLIGKGKPLIGPLGREWFIEPFTNFKGELQLPVTKAVNYPTQGTGADVMMLARISFRNRMHMLPNAKYVKMISTVHDSIVLDGHEEHILPCAKLFNDVFADLPKNIEKIFGYKWSVPLACETKFGKDMKNMSKVA